MSAHVESARARRYLLGQASEDESAAIEQEYFAGDDALDRMAAAEDDLIEDYLAEELSPAERERFERSYLAAPQHRVRVETMRRLMAQASQGGSSHSQKILRPSWRRVVSKGPLLALAASLLLVAWVMSRPAQDRPGSVADSRIPQPSAQAPAAPAPPPVVPRLLALTVSPVSVRSAVDSPTVDVPVGTDTLAILLEADADSRTLTASRVSIRTVGGQDVWQGGVTSGSDLPAGAIARIEVPAARLPADDYLITLYGNDRERVEQEMTQYFLRVRNR